MTNAEAAARSRAALLLAGAALVVRDVRSKPLPTLTVRGVCSEAGYTTGAFYQHWAGPDEYRAALAAHLLALDEATFAADAAELTVLADETADYSTLDAILAVAEADFQKLLSDPQWDAMELLNVTWARDAPYKAMAIAGYRQLDELTSACYEHLLHIHGRELRAPLTASHLGAILQGLIEGVGLRHRVDRAAVDDAEIPGDSGLYALAVACLLAVVSKATDDTRDLPTLLKELLQESRA